FLCHRWLICDDSSSARRSKRTTLRSFPLECLQLQSAFRRHCGCEAGPRRRACDKMSVAPAVPGRCVLNNEPAQAPGELVTAGGAEYRPTRLCAPAARAADARPRGPGLANLL